MQLPKRIQRCIQIAASLLLPCKSNTPQYKKLTSCLGLAKLILLISLTPHLSANTATDTLFNIYETAKANYNLGDYEKCQDSLKPLVTSDLSTSITPYVFFYYALAAYKNGMPEVAEQTFLQLLTENPDWDQKNEVLYWLAQLRFEQGDYLQAFTYLDPIRSMQFLFPMQQLKKYFLQQDLSPQQFTILLTQYPDDIIIAQEWLKQQIQLPFIQQDKIRMQQVATKWKLLKWLYDPLSKLTSTKKDSYHVAIFLPFFIDTFNYEEHKHNYFIIDLYQGIQAAVEKLQQEGINIVLHAYDTQKSATITAKLLEQEELKYMDLFIGPLYPETVPLVAAFARTHGINLFNPLSNNAHIVGNNPFIYLLHPSIETQVKAAADFTIGNVQNATNIQIGVVYTDAPQDVHKASIYKSYIEQNSALSINCMLAFDLNTLQKLLHSFREPAAKHSSEVSTLKNLTHIYIASQDELLVANILSIVQIANTDCCIIADEIWLKKPMITTDQLQQMNINFVAPTYLDYDQPTFLHFRNNFYTRFGAYPNYYATIGYEIMYFLGTMLYKHGTYFQKHWEEDTTRGQVFAGFKYGAHHDNQIVPIIHFKNSKFRVAKISRDYIN